MSNDGTAAISANAGSVLDCLWRRNSSVASEDTNRSRYSSECWNLSSLPGRKLSCGERRRKVGYLRAATFNGKSGDPMLSIEFFHFRGSFTKCLHPMATTKTDKTPNIMKLYLIIYLKIRRPQRKLL